MLIAKFVWAANSGTSTGGTYTAGTGIDIAGTVISIEDDGVDTAQIAAEAIETEQVNDDAITLGKLAHGTADTYIGFDSSGVPTELDCTYWHWWYHVYTAGDGIDISSDVISVADDGVTLAKLASGTADTYVGFDSSGNPTELDAPVADLGDAAQRAEQLVFAAITSEVTQTADQSATLAATSFASVTYPDGETTLEMLTATASETTVTILNAGIYALDFEAVVVVPGDRAYPSLEIYENSAVIGTDNPLMIMPTVYIREDSTFVRSVAGSGHLRIAFGRYGYQVQLFTSGL